MPSTEASPILADAANVLSDQLRVHLQRLARLIEPHADSLEHRFLARMKQLRLDPRQRTAMAAITPGAAARTLARRWPPLEFFEQLEYHGRRLAKLNLPPTLIAEAFREYDRLLAPILRRLNPEEYANFQWAREQLHFCAILTLNNAYYQVRESETQAFYELFRVELESRGLEELLKRFLEILTGFCRADAGHLYLLDDAGATWVPKASVVRGTGQRKGFDPPPPAPVPNTSSIRRKLSRPRYMSTLTDSALLDPGWRDRYACCWSVPLTDERGIAGVMQFAFVNTYQWLPREEELLAAAAERCLMAAQKARLVEDLAAREEQIRQLAEHMLHVEEMERRRISRELHDEAGQSLLCIRLQMEMLEDALPESMAEIRTRLAEARDLTEKTILEMRRLISALSPAVLEQLGLGAALRQLVNRFRRIHNARVRLQLSRLARLPNNLEIIVYRLVQECFNNIAKHSGASTVNISVSSADGILRLQVEDDGVGFVVEEAFARRDSFGLAGIRERVTLLGGRLEVRSWPSAQDGLGKRESGQSGTKIAVELPISRKR